MEKKTSPGIHCNITPWQDDPEPGKCLGVFGLSLYTQERDLRDVFARYGELDECNIVYDRQSGRSRGFAFVYFRNVEDSIEVRPQGIVTVLFMCLTVHDWGEW